MPINLTELEQHELYLSRLASGGINAHVYPSLEVSYKAIRRILQDEEVILSQAQLNKVLSAVAKAIDDNGGWVTLTDESLQALAVYEASWQAQFIGAALATSIKTPAEKKILSYVNKALMSLESGQRVTSGTWEQFYRANLDSRKKAINSIIRTGYSRGETINQMSQKIRTNFNGVLKREAETLARTGYIHYATSARRAMAADNKDILNEVVSVSVLDNRTTLMCMSLDGRRWDIDDPGIVWAPSHFGCRRSMLFVQKGQELTGTKPSIGGKAGAADEFKAREKRLRKASQVRYKGRKDNDIFTVKSVNANTQYGQWLSKQPPYFIRDTLGEKRAELFMSGQLDIRSFTDLSGRPLTLEQLRRRHPDIVI